MLRVMPLRRRWVRRQADVLWIPAKGAAEAGNDELRSHTTYTCVFTQYFPTNVAGRYNIRE
jgi:hypothetical protein